MSPTYFDRVVAGTPTRLWINNPSRAETRLAIANHAINCTTNPAYCSKLLQSDPDWLREVIDAVVQVEANDDIAADLVLQKTAGWVMEQFRPLFDESDGAYGYVTIQADPREDDDADLIIEAALRHRKLGPNYMAKIPVIRAGIQAIEALVAENIPICATEIFSIAQTTHMCEVYEAAVRKTGNRPVFFITHITGIFDEFLAGIVKSEKIAIAPEALAQAGFIVGRREYEIVKERGYDTTILLGGARHTGHFTEFVGGDIHCTINWSTAQELIELDLPVESRIDAPADPTMVEELMARIPHVYRAYVENAIPMEQFKDYGPVVHFRNAFMAGYTRLLEEVAARRRLLNQ
jgi:transaldolase